MNAPRPPLLLAFALAAATAACGEDFPPFNRLNPTDLRILAVRTTPVAPKTGESTTMDALVWNPNPATPNVTYHWRWCPFTGPSNDGHPCPSEAEIAPFIPNLPSFELGTAPTATFTNTIDPAALTCVCAKVEERATACPPGVGAQLPPAGLDCSLGFPAKIRLTVSNGVQSIEAVRTLRLRTSDAQPANENPTVGGLVAALPGGDAPIDLLGSVVLPRKTETLLRLAMPAVAEPYLLPDGTMQTESLFLTWYVESGDTRILNTSYLPTVTAPQMPFENKWSPGGVADYTGPQAHVFVVATDNRQGFGWTEGVVTLGAEQP